MTGYDFCVRTTLTDTISGQSQTCSSNHALTAKTRCPQRACVHVQHQVSHCSSQWRHTVAGPTQHSLVNLFFQSCLDSLNTLCFLLGMYACLHYMQACQCCWRHTVKHTTQHSFILFRPKHPNSCWACKHALHGYKVLCLQMSNDTLQVCVTQKDLCKSVNAARGT